MTGFETIPASIPNGDQIGVWRLRKALAMDNARWIKKTPGYKILILQDQVNLARFCSREIVRIKLWLRYIHSTDVGDVTKRSKLLERFNIAKVSYSDIPRPQGAPNKGNKGHSHEEIVDENLCP